MPSSVDARASPRFPAARPRADLASAFNSAASALPASPFYSRHGWSAGTQRPDITPSIAASPRPLRPRPVAVSPEAPPGCLRFFRDRIKPVTAERMTARESRNSQPSAAPCAMATNGLGGVTRTTRLMAASHPEKIKQGRQGAFVKPDCAKRRGAWEAYGIGRAGALRRDSAAPLRCGARSLRLQATVEQAGARRE